jgi:ubiquinol-cytochrome c reductase iron-sulfur subunit
MAMAIGGLGLGVIAMAKRIMPHEVAVQERHHGMSDEVSRRTLAAEVADAGYRSGLVKRRGMIKGTLFLAGGGLATMAAVPIIGGLISNPWAKADQAPLWVTLWAPTVLPDGTVQKVRLSNADGTPVRPQDMAAGGMMTVFPGVPGGAKAGDSAVLLFRFRSDTSIMVRTGQENFSYGDFYAYSKICTHVGCPASLYEQQTGRLLCPCHQSQFDLHDGARPIFGPATRPLPQLPIELDADGFFVAGSDFHEAVGPGFWENGKFPAWSSHPQGSPS